MRNAVSPCSSLPRAAHRTILTCFSSFKREISLIAIDYPYDIKIPKQKAENNISAEYNLWPELPVKNRNNNQYILTYSAVAEAPKFQTYLFLVVESNLLVEKGNVKAQNPVVWRHASSQRSTLFRATMSPVSLF